MVSQIGAPAAAIRDHEELFAYWAAKRVGARLPARRDIRPEGFKRLLPTISLIETRGGDALDFRIRLAGTTLYTVYGLEITGRAVGEVYAGAAADYWRGELAKVAREAKPGVGVHNLAWRGAPHLSIVWLRLPLASNGTDVDMILGFDALVGMNQLSSGIRAA